MSLHKKQIDILKKYFNPVSRYKNKEQRTSLILIARENTLLTMKQIAKTFHVCTDKSSEIKAVYELSTNKEFNKVHKDNVEKLKKLGFRFI